MKTALVLSGGGAKGAFQAGALEVLAGQDIQYESIAGVSVGALNGVMVSAQRLPRLMEIWKTIREDEVYTKRSFFQLGLQFLLYRIGFRRAPKSVYSNEPLKKLLQKEFRDIEMKIPITIGRVNLETGTYISEIDPQSPDFASEVVASTAIPVLWEPVRVRNQLFVDGGIRNTTPLKEVVLDKPDRIIVITNAPLNNFKEERNLEDILEIAERSLDILMNEIFIEDIKKCMQINNLVRQAASQGLTLTSDSGRPLKEFELCIIQPPEPLGSALNFGRQRLDELLIMGREAAEKALA
jgi:NTE family protein